MMAMTQRSSILKKVDTRLYALACFSFPLSDSIVSEIGNATLLSRCRTERGFQYIHGPRGGGNDGDVLSLHGDGPRDVELRGQLPHHQVPDTYTYAHTHTRNMRQIGNKHETDIKDETNIRQTSSVPPTQVNRSTILIMVLYIVNTVQLTLNTQYNVQKESNQSALNRHWSVYPPQDFGTVIVVLHGVLHKAETIHVTNIGVSVGSQQVKATHRLLKVQQR